MRCDDMTIAELQLARMRPIDLATTSLAELDRARKVRRYNVLAMIALWAAVWSYGLDRLVTASDLAAGVDRFLPLQLLAAIAATAVFAGRKSLRRGFWERRLALVPALATFVGALALVWSVYAQFGVHEAPDSDAAGAHPPFKMELVSL